MLHALTSLPSSHYANIPSNSAADTRKVRDACVVAKGEDDCKVEIEAHKACLREDGFKI